MKASDFVDQIERRYDVAILEHAGRLAVLGLDRLPRHVTQAVAAHRDLLCAWLERRADATLRIAQGQTELRRLGFVRMPETGAWCHPAGDEAGDAVLAGLLDPDVVAAEHEARLDALRRTGIIPPATDIEHVEDLRQVAPGVWRWAQRARLRYRDPFPSIHRL